jgi:hypothetical protein
MSISAPTPLGSFGRKCPTLVPEPPAAEGWIHEIKHDGYRTLIVIDQGKVSAFSRHGRDGTRVEVALQHIALTPFGPSANRGIVGSYETRKPGIDYPCMIGDIEKTAGLTVYEPDDGLVQFAKWRPLDQNAPSRSAVSAPAREDQVAGRGE